MKTIKNLFLLMTILCLIGCGGDDPEAPPFVPQKPSSGSQQENVPQSVKFDKSELTIGRKGGNLDVIITANCEWYVAKTSEEINLSKDFGTGNDTIAVTVPPNSQYDNIVYTLKLTSQDKKSSSSLTITQGENLGLKAESVDTLKAEGGQFDIAIQTNDRIQIVEFPEWVSLVESKSLRDSTLLLNAEANKSGSIRDAILVLQGEGTKQEVKIIQHSFSPTGVEVNIPDELPNSDNPYVYEIKLVPEYADWSKLSFAAEGGEATFEDKMLSILVKEPGTCKIIAYSLSEEIFTKDISVYDSSYPTSIEIDLPEVLCEGRHAYKIHVFPETSDVSKLKVMNAIKGVDFSIKGDSLYVDIKPEHFRPILSIFSNGENVYYKDFDVISDDATFNLNNGDVFVIGETIQIDAEIPLTYADFWISDHSVLEEIEHGKFIVKSEGTCTIELTNKISGKSHSVYVEGRQVHMYAKLLKMGPELFDTYRIIEVSIKGFNLGPGKFMFESGGNSILLMDVSEHTDFPNFKNIEIKDNIPQFSDKDKFKKYKITYTGYINENYTTYITEGEF